MKISGIWEKTYLNCSSLIFSLLITIFALTFVGCSGGGGDGNQSGDNQIVKLTTTRDDKGVWFISGDPTESLYNVFEAMGYAVATDRLWQAEMYRWSARGTLSEIFGQQPTPVGYPCSYNRLHRCGAGSRFQ